MNRYELKFNLIKLLIKIDFKFIFEIYKRLYDRINSQKSTPKEIIYIQKCLVYIVELLKDRKDKCVKCDIYNYEYLIEIFRMLANNILNVYIIESDVDTNRNLTLDQYGNDNYDKNNIYNYLSTAEKMVDSEDEVYIVVVDLCMGNIEWGDLISREGNSIIAYELKDPTPKNIEIMNAVESKKVNPFANKYDREQFDRLKKQKEKQNIISENLSTRIWFNNGSLTLPYDIEDVEKYDMIFAHIVNNYNNELIAEHLIDDCIKIVIINSSIVNHFWYKKEFGFSEALDYIKKSIQRISVKDIVRYQEFASKDSNDYDKFIYNDVLLEAFLPQPYAIGIRGKAIKRIIRGEIGIYITVDIDNLFDRFREKGFKVYSKKGQMNHSALFYKNKNWVISKGEFNGLFGLSLIHRLVYGFYTTDGLVDFVEKHLVPVVTLEE